MATTVADLTSIQQVLIKVGENGYMIQFEGESETNNWYNVPFVAKDIDEAVEIVKDKLSKVGNTTK